MFYLFKAKILCIYNLQLKQYICYAVSIHDSHCTLIYNSKFLIMIFLVCTFYSSNTMCFIYRTRSNTILFMERMYGHSYLLNHTLIIILFTIFVWLFYCSWFLLLNPFAISKYSLGNKNIRKLIKMYFYGYRRSITFYLICMNEIL